MSEINNPEVPGPISERSMRHIDARIEAAGSVVSQQIASVGGHEFYKKSWRRLPDHLTNNIRSLVDSCYPRRGEEARKHPFAYAIERGLVAGMMLADRAMKSNTSFGTFAKRMSGEFRSLSHTLPASPYDLEDVLVRTGGSFGDKLTGSISPVDLMRFDMHDNSPIEMRRQSMYASAVGFVGVAAVGKLVEQEIKRAQPTDRIAARSIRGDLDFILYVDEPLTAGHFLDQSTDR